MTLCADALTPDPAFEALQETRFAVVMYGGVSLAIYMNGITMELLNLVRATPRPGQRPALKGTELVYRALAERLKSRFVVDVLAGTSAGGINGIFLAKALANDQDIRELRDLWINEGEISLLINDSGSVRETPLKQQSPPASLLNSQRMYWKLLAAFNGMGKDGAGPSPYADELDLFVTTTDIKGLTLPIRLSDALVEERRHRNVFHFTYCTPESRGESRNDFQRSMNPFLAFAARCTSAFPFAFQPMRLKDIDPVLDALPDEKQSLRSHAWAGTYADFFPGYEPEEICLRAFGDGGYLDNKPFAYATDTLAQRHAELPVTRKLIYIEPAPEHPELEPLDLEHPPDFIQNVVAALTLPSYETIREDLQRVIGRNRFIGRVDEIMRSLEADAAAAGKGGLKASRSAEEYVQSGLKALIQARGTAYGAYHRLKVESVTDDLARLVTRLVGFDEASDEFRAVRYFLKAWRLESFAEEPDGGKETETAFLMRYDLGYRLRRLEFLRTKINDLNCLNGRAQQIVDGATLERAEVGPAVPLPFRLPADDPGRDEFRLALGDIKRKLSPIYRQLRITRHRLWTRDDLDLVERLGAMGVGRDELKQVLAPRDEAERLGFARSHVREHAAAFRDIAKAIADRLEGPAKDAAGAATGLLDSAPPAGATPLWRVIQRCLWHYYQYYEDYDSVRFPLLYCTDAGEAVPVDVVRISPEDTTTDRVNGQPKAHKLGGASLAHFGAFLEKAWRQNDIMWGRLDAAERLISTLWPDGQDVEGRNALIDCAHKIILAEELQTADRSKLYDLLARALAENVAGTPTLADLRALLEERAATPLQETLQSVLRACVEDEDALLRYMRATYQVDPQPNTQRALEAMARSTRVIGGMLQGQAQRPGVQPVAKWVVRLGQFFWGLVEVAVPGSLSHEFFRHAVRLLYFSEAVMIAGGMLFTVPAVTGFGWKAFAVTAALHVLVLLVGDLMRGSPAGRGGMGGMLSRLRRRLRRQAAPPPRASAKR